MVSEPQRMAVLKSAFSGQAPLGPAKDRLRNTNVFHNLIFDGEEMDNKKTGPAVKTVSIRDVVLGRGRPKICIPVVGRTEDEIAEQAEKVISCPCDMVEFADFFKRRTLVSRQSKTHPKHHFFFFS